MQRALGEIKPASTTTAQRATNNQAQPATQYPAQAIMFQALAGNTGSVFICDRAVPSLTANVHAEIPPPNAVAPITRPSWTAGNPASSNGLNAADYWILPAVSGEGVRVTVIRS